MKIDSEMKASLGTNMELRGKHYRQQISLERKFMKQIVSVSRELSQEFGVENTIEIIRNSVQLSHAETNTIRQWLVDEEEVFMSGVIPCIVTLTNKRTAETLHKPFVTSVDEQREFAKNLPKYKGEARLWLICQLYDLKDYVSRNLGDTLNDEVQMVIESVENNTQLSVDRLMIYSSEGKIRDITQPRYDEKTYSTTSVSAKRNVLYVQFMCIPFSLFGQRKYVLEASNDLDNVVPDTLDRISKFISNKLSTEIMAMDPVFDDELPEFLYSLPQGTMEASEGMLEEKKVANGTLSINKNNVLPPPEDLGKAILNFFFLSSMKCPGCGKIHEEDARITGISNEEQWNVIVNEYFYFLKKRKDSVLMTLSSDQEIVRNWSEAADSLRQVLLGNIEL